VAKLVVTGTTDKPGPNLVYGVDTIASLLGTDATERPSDPAKVIALCGCGKSRTRPYCDGSHMKAGG
jgi:CDGSH-type Zn-finger protein